MDIFEVDNFMNQGSQAVLTGSQHCVLFHSVLDFTIKSLNNSVKLCVRSRQFDTNCNAIFHVSATMDNGLHLFTIRRSSLSIWVLHHEPQINSYNFTLFDDLIVYLFWLRKTCHPFVMLFRLEKLNVFLVDDHIVDIFHELQQQVSNGREILSPTPFAVLYEGARRLQVMQLDSNKQNPRVTKELRSCVMIRYAKSRVTEATRL